MFVRETNKYRITLYCFVSYHISLDRIVSYRIVYLRRAKKKKNTCDGQTEASAEKSSPHKTVTPVRFSVTFSAGGKREEVVAMVTVKCSL